MPGKTPKTLREIAQEARVSVTTASMYINGKAEQYRISKGTCQRIQSVIDRENYIPNLNARAMACKRTDLIGCMIYQQLSESFWSEIISGIDEILSPKGKHLLLTVTGQSHQSELEAFDYLRAKGVDGIFWVPVLDGCTAVNSPRAAELSQSVPIVVMAENLPDFPSVYNDGFTGGWQAAEHLLQTGHESFAIFGRSSHHPDRVEGFRQCLRQAGMTAAIFTDPALLLKSSPAGTGVFCVSDQRAMILYQQAHELGKKVPHDLSIIGFDNLSFGQLLSPPLTTIHQEKNRLGQEAARLMLNLLQEKKQPSIRLETHLIQRNSVRKKQ